MQQYKMMWELCANVQLKRKRSHPHEQNLYANYYYFIIIFTVFKKNKK